MQLILAAGDIIDVTKQTSSGWWQGTCNGSSGWFPSNYTEEAHPPLPPLPPTPDAAAAAGHAAADAHSDASLSAQLLARKGKRGSAVPVDAANAAAAAEVGFASSEPPPQISSGGGGGAGDV